MNALHNSSLYITILQWWRKHLVSGSTSHTFLHSIGKTLVPVGLKLTFAIAAVNEVHDSPAILITNSTNRPGWLVRYAVGPYDVVWIENLIADVCAGVTVALTLIPQGNGTTSTTEKLQCYCSITANSYQLLNCDSILDIS